MDHDVLEEQEKKSKKANKNFGQKLGLIFRPILVLGSSRMKSLAGKFASAALPLLDPLFRNGLRCF
jgi:hypothetical protein